MKKVYLIHGWSGKPSDKAWFGWLRRECEKKGIEFEFPEMPDTDYPKIEEWVGKLNEIVRGEKIYLIGHSIGNQAIMRYLEQLEEGRKIKGVVFVAGFFNLLEGAYEDEEEIDVAKPWLETPIDCEKVRKRFEKILAIFSTDDDCVPLSDSELFKEKLGAEIIVKENEGHFNEINEIMEFIEDEKNIP